MPFASRWNPTRAVSRALMAIMLAVFAGVFPSHPAVAQSSQGDDWVLFDSRTTLSFDAQYAATLTATATAAAEGSTADFQQWREYDKRIQAASSVSDLSPGLFGDAVNHYNGTLSFSVTDISVPGNSDLSVTLTRTFEVMDYRGDPIDDKFLGDWDLDIPRISGTYAPDWPADRCTNTAKAPTAESGATSYPGYEYWQGNTAAMPGGGELLRADQGASQPTSGGPYPWMTPGFTYFSCLPSIQHGGGEGFKAITASGTEYTFDWLVQYDEPALNNPTSAAPSPQPLTRKRNVLYATKVQDRFGNWVQYTFDAANPRQLKSISASDGRQIALAYNARGFVSSATVGTRQWTYRYANDTDATQPPTLTKVTLPDASQWTLDFKALSDTTIDYASGDPPTACGMPQTILSQNGGLLGTGTGTVTHPSGATGTFILAPQRSGRTNVPKFCANWTFPDEQNDPADDVAMYPRASAVLALRTKRIAGPGLPTQEWTYEHVSGSSWAAGTGPKCDTPDCLVPVCVDDSCAGTNETTVTAPDGSWERHVYGNSYRYNEGKLLRIERGSGATVIRSDTLGYEWAQSGQPFPTPVGTSPRDRGEGFTAEYLRPQHRTVIAQDGASFTWQVDPCGTTACFDALARPTRVSRSSASLGSVPSGFSTTETTTYHDDPALWVLGQVASVTDLATGKKISETSYDARALPVTFKSFGLLTRTLGYNADGTVSTDTDGNNHTVALSGWKRGIPQLITFADNSKLTATVDDLGQITATTDELLTTTTYTYDAMGRLASLSIPGWAPTSFSFVPVPSAEFGLAAGHWRHTETTGTYKKTTYFDARFRPLLSLEEDTANAASKRYTTRAFDHDNRETFASYPEASATSVTSLTQGTHTTYDALGRVTSVAQNDGPSTFLTTRTDYLAGFQTRTTNPRGQSTTVSYQAYDTPDTSAPVSILGPDGVSTAIVRDGFRMPLSVTRSGLYAGLPVSARRSYVYDAFERLCKRIEPESGATLFDYDGVGNLAWSAEGQPLLSLSCDRASVPASARTTRSYDARDRLLSVSYPNAPTTLYGYAPDGALTTLTQGDSAWSYSYNNRRLLTNETLSFGDSYAFSYSYNALGHLASVSTPGSVSIDYAPNALGQPTKAGSFASNATYFPDGSLKQFSYGNGLIHSVTQNGRHLPQQVRDALGTQVVHDFRYGYDQNGNVTTITDNDQAGLQSKSLLYDARDRLVSATATPLWGTASYSYDPLDNLRVADQGSRQYRYQYDSSNRLTQLTDPSGTLITDFAYDAQGRQIRKGTQTRSFDGANRITAIAGETYAYDGSGRRIATWAADGRTKVEVYTQDGKLGFAVDSAKGGGSSFVYLAGQRIAEDHWNCGTDTHTATYFHSDALGSPVATTDANRTVLERTYYAPYGEALNRTVDGPGYTGHVMDAATGLVYAQQRYYDPVVGKFLSIDPVAADPGTGGNFNRYWYANNNPYKFTDPDGRLPTSGDLIRKGQQFVRSQVVRGAVAAINEVADAATSAVQQGVQDARNFVSQRDVVVTVGVTAVAGAPVVGNSVATPSTIVMANVSVVANLSNGQIGLQASVAPLVGFGGGAAVTVDGSVGLSNGPLKSGFSDAQTTFVQGSAVTSTGAPLEFGASFTQSADGGSVSTGIRGGVGTFVGGGTGPVKTATLVTPLEDE